MNTRDFMTRLAYLKIQRDSAEITGQQYNRELLLVHEEHAFGLMVANPAFADALTSSHVLAAKSRPQFIHSGLDVDGWYVVMQGRKAWSEEVVRTTTELSLWDKC